MTKTFRLIAVCGALALLPAMLMAQRSGRGDPRRQQGQLPPDQRMGQLIRSQLQLTDAQVPKFQEANGRFSERRRAINQEEMAARMSMRDALCSGDAARSGEVAKSIDQLIDIQKRRVHMLEDEQRELSTFLTPSQRARFLGIGEFVGDAMRGGRGGGRGGRGGPPPDGGPPPEGRPPRDGPGGMGRGGPPPDICAAPPPGDGGPRGLRGRGGS